MITSCYSLHFVNFCCHFDLFFSSYLVFDHGAEMVIPEKDTELSLLHSRGELT